MARYIKQSECFSTIPSVKSAGGEIFTWAIDINNAFKEFYLDLYSSKSSSTEEDIRNFVEPLGLPKLTTEQKNSLDSQIRGQMALPLSFFRSYASELAPLLLEVYTETLKNGNLPPTMEQAQISLILTVQFP